ncbi:glycosyl hydrolase family 18 protein [Ferdinandcohnia quinoae]|uniref:Glycosyl hydrolase family 18 protein n=1 Tax=Fredinandcohnia quinoae TaxID=2918902 RepID=A0AAW5E036_9BACI|nr:glycosyl hydrolase family 18 protein [Fredinandcohnia sp. SECRCQ15]MCH1625663.1 glycosyl hydrolase family 18 protein [Fredinandcohnia sp. SECRCQ15]
MSRIERTKRKTSSTFILFGFILSFILIGTSLVLWLYPFPSKEKTTFTNMKYPIISDGEIYPDEALIENGTVYFPLSFIQATLDDGIIIDQDSNSIILTTKEKVYQMPSESLTIFVNEEPHKLEFPIYTTKDNTPYISIDPFQSLYQVQYKYHKETGITVLKRNGDTIQKGVVKDNQKEYLLHMRSEADLSTPYVSEVKPSENVYIEKDVENYYYIRKENGIAGFVKKDILNVGDSKKLAIKPQERVQSPLQALSLPINLTWEAVYSKNPNTKLIPNMTGVNIVSPTWFSLKNNEGDVKNLGSTAYREWAQSKGYQVWGLFSNDFDPEKTHEAFNDFETRKKIIRQLLEYSNMYQLDGINFDIENVNEADGPLVTQFIKEATPYLHKAGLVVSMDITFISDSSTWSKFYEREKLAAVVDYMVVMAYDEHWGTSPVSGSVASLPWVERNLERLLEVVPHDQLVLAVPLYARIWKEADTEAGNVEVSSKALSMNDVQQWIKERNLTPTYDEQSGQNYVEYRDDNEKATYKIWIEDELSLQKRIQLIHKYDLAGVASWTRFFANDTAWTSISQALKEENKK